MNNRKKQLTLGILAHVDAGKTTLAESILYITGVIRKLGRVDHKNAFLDTFEMERSRGITIFSKQARFDLGDMAVTLLDTPGHVDFSAEMERTLQVLDYAVLVISGPNGIQGHDLTLWRLLKQYQIPVFIFVNKMDQPGVQAEHIMKEIQKQLDGNCIRFDTEKSEQFFDELAMCDEAFMQEFLETEKITESHIAEGIAERKIYPCYFGSALKVQGVEEFLNSLKEYIRLKKYPQEFGARVYKISRDNQGKRLTHLKITGGSLRVKQVIGMGDDIAQADKVDQIRLYSGASYSTAEEVEAGGICAVTGLAQSYAGQGIGIEGEAELPVLEPILSYRIELPPGSDVHGMFVKLRQLEEEEPALHIVWDEHLQEIHARVMGDVQIEVLKKMIQERYGVSVEFGAGSITYKETIAAPVEGVGHFEPLRHYAEVHLLLEPLERGSGLHFDTVCSEDVLDKNWQRLIMTHLEEKQHVGVLTGSEITDMKITILTGKAHLKHTEGGDFRQATYRAIRQGLKMAKSVLLEPVYAFRLEIPADQIGRAMTDITRMKGQFSSPIQEGETAIIEGTAPVANMWEYQKEVTSYSRGKGRLNCVLKGYEECHNTEKVIEAIGYDSELDLENPSGSVFCAHGAGFVVPWYEVRQFMHLESGWVCEEDFVEEEPLVPVKKTSAVYAASAGFGDDKELEEIFSRTYNSKKEPRGGWNKRKISNAPVRVERPVLTSQKPKEDTKEYVLVDGYNIIFAIPELKELAEINIDSARDKLADLLCNYQGFKNNTLILVFDAYKVEGGVGSVLKYHNIYVVYTKEAETADQYIEKTVHEIGKKYHVTVATSDALEQKIIWGAGASRMSAKGLWEELQSVRKEIQEQFLEKKESSSIRLFDHADKELAKEMEKVRLGKKSLTNNVE